MKKRRIFINSYGEYYTDVGRYRVVEKGKRFHAIYDFYGTFITHKTSWKQAVKLANLLDDAFNRGADYGYQNYF